MIKVSEQNDLQQMLYGKAEIAYRYYRAINNDKKKLSKEVEKEKRTQAKKNFHLLKHKDWDLIDKIVDEIYKEQKEWVKKEKQKAKKA
jgi:hypothetical protein